MTSGALTEKFDPADGSIRCISWATRASRGPASERSRVSPLLSRPHITSFPASQWRRRLGVPLALAREAGCKEVWGRLSQWRSPAKKEQEGETAEHSGHADHIAHARELDPESLGRRPDDLADVLTRVAHGIGAMFNKPEIALLLRAGAEETQWREALDHCLRGGLQAVLDEYAHVLIGSEGLQDAEPHARAERLGDAMLEALGVRSAVNRMRAIDVVSGRVRMNDEQRLRSHLAARYGRTGSDAGEDREAVVRAAFNSPFRPFVLASTSVGQEGLDFHTYSHAIIHWNLPSNPVDMEQREGRVHRYKGHAVRKNVAAAHAGAAFASADADAWEAAFDAARAEVVGPDGDSGNSGPDGLRPYWVYTGASNAGSARIERCVPAMPLSKEVAHYHRLRRTVADYRLVMGQPRQEDLVEYISGVSDGSARSGDALDWMRIDLMPKS